MERKDPRTGDDIPWDSAPPRRTVGSKEGKTVIKSGTNNTPRTLEVHLEELDAHSWLRAVPDTLLA